VNDLRGPELPAGLRLEHELLAVAWRAARSGGELLRAGRHDELQVATKTSRTDVVTQMDTASERLIAETILSARPDDGLLGEEGSERSGTSGVRWVIDPLDGTVNYLYGLPSWAVSIAAEVDGSVVVGVVDIPVLGETFLGVRGQGARWVTDRTVRTPQPNAPDRLGQCLVATGFSYYESRRVAQSRTLTQVLPTVRDIRRAGVAAVDLCWTAAGLVDCYYERGLNPWDLAAGALVAAESGLVVGGPPGERPSGELTWAAPSSVAGEFEALLHAAGAHLD
jgi:myo-inositol-1(or 4)-monophosphatase